MFKECSDKAEKQTKFRGFVRTFIDLYQSFPTSTIKNDLDHLIRLSKDDLPDALGEKAKDYTKVLEELKYKITDDYDPKITEELRNLEKNSFAEMLEHYCKCRNKIVEEEE